MTEARWALTAMVLVLLYHQQIMESRLLLRQNAPTLLILTLCGQVSFPLTLYIGLQSTSALNAAIYMSATPAWFLLLIGSFFATRLQYVIGWGLSLARQACWSSAARQP
jgi:drug/metabolite transporter (DMT)-like permease